MPVAQSRQSEQWRSTSGDLDLNPRLSDKPRAQLCQDHTWPAPHSPGAAPVRTPCLNASLASVSGVRKLISKPMVIFCF